MSIYEVHFIQEANDPEQKHLVVEVEASTPDEAEDKARKMMKENGKWLGTYKFFSRELKRF